MLRVPPQRLWSTGNKGDEPLTDIWGWPLIALLGGYLLGAIPFGVLLTRLAGAGDLRQIGSGNIGATNVLRTGRKGLAALTLLLDGGKGAAAVLLAAAIAPDVAPLVAASAGAGAFLGHLYPVWLRFRGGKGVATLLGIALALWWPAGLAFAGVWLLAALVSRYSSVGGIAGGFSPAVAAAFAGQPGMAFYFLALAGLVLWKHRGNIQRLIAGTEPRIGAKSLG